MKKLILTALTSFFLGGIVTLLTINYLNPSASTNNLDSSNKIAIHGSTWISEETGFQLSFAENDNICYMEKLSNDLMIPLEYSKMDNQIIIEPKNEMSTLFLLTAFKSANISAIIEDNLTLTLKNKNGKLTFKRLN
ncbi:MAG: hypothetical protein WED10_06465 [Brumimicrobium sp.]